MTFDKFWRRQSHPIVEGYVLVFGRIEYIDQLEGRLADILDVVAQGPRNEADVAGCVVECPRLARGVEDGRPSLALKIILLLVRVRVPMKLAHGAGFDLHDEG